jgi:2-polyprenyl-3-methyl-5-hydroxy-6-metoxy-1,4-benzoquinol methylase
MIFEHVRVILSQANDLAEVGEIGAMWELLRSLDADVFVHFMGCLPDGRFPHLSRCLPVYPAKDVQIGWAGNHGDKLTQQTALFLRTANNISLKFAQKDLGGARIIDYGCGWGRVMRAMLYYSNEVYGVDPWDKSISVCREHGIGDQVSLIDYEPDTLPYEDNFFDFGYAFSVFTHLGEKTMRSIFNSLSKVLRDRSIFIATIRPIEYWDQRGALHSKAVIEEMKERHRLGQVAFVPTQALSAGSLVYGEASCSVACIASLAADCGFALVGTDHIMSDPFQRLVVLQKVV